MCNLITKQPTLRYLLLSMLVLITVGCGSHSTAGLNSEPAQSMQQTLPDLSSLPALHSPSLAYNEVRLGSETYARAGTAVVSGSTLELPSAVASMCWGIWAWDVQGRNITRVNYDIDLPPGNAVYIAVADYSADCWRIFGPHDNGLAFELDPARNVSPGGTLYCAALTWDEDSATVRRITLTEETGSNYNEAEDNSSLIHANQLPGLPFSNWLAHIGPPGSGGDGYDYYSFQAENGQVVTITLTYNSAQSTVYLALYDSDQQIIAKDEDGNPGSRQIRQGLTAGTKWVRVRALSGESDYTLAIALETPGYDELEDNDGFTSAQQITAPVNDFLGNAGAGGYNGDDLDYYSFAADEGDQLSVGLDYDSAAANLYLRLYDPSKQSITYDESGNTGHRALSWGLSAGIYYVRVSAASGAADYTLNLGLTSPGYNELEDNDSFAGANPLTVPVAGWLGNAGSGGYDGDAYDYYSFDAAEGEQVTATLSYSNADANLYLRLYGPSEATITSDESGNTGVRSISWGLKAGVHYLSVRAYSGMADYNLGLTLTNPGYNETEDNDSFAQADPATTETDWHGSVGAGGYDGDLADYYTFDAAEGQIVTATLTYNNLTGNVSLRLYGPDQMTIVTDEVGSPGMRTVSWGLKAGANFFRPYAESGYSDYHLTFSLSNPGYNESEDNDTRAQANPLPALPLSNWSGSVGPGSYDGDNSDYVTFTVSSAATLSFHLDYDNSSGANVDLYIQDGSGTTLDSDSAGNPGSRDVSYAFSPGSYYLRIRATLGHSNYQLDGS